MKNIAAGSPLRRPSDELRDFLERRKTERLRQLHASPAEPFVRRLGKLLVPPPWRYDVRLLATRALAPIEKRRAKQFVGGKLHIGAGSILKKDWCNMDLAGTHIDLRWDLARGLPFPNGSLQAIFSEHLVEHLPLEAALRLLEESHRVLTSDGVCRIGVPDAGRYFRSYAAGDRFPLERWPGSPTAMLALNEVIYHPGHLTMYDEETLGLLFEAAGFVRWRCCEFGESILSPCPDSESRREDTLYVEAAAHRSISTD